MLTQTFNIVDDNDKNPVITYPETNYRIGVNTTAPFYYVLEVLDVVVFKLWMKFYPKTGKKAPKTGLLGKKVPLYSNLHQGAVIIKTAVVLTPIRYLF